MCGIVLWSSVAAEVGRPAGGAARVSPEAFVLFLELSGFLLFHVLDC